MLKKHGQLFLTIAIFFDSIVISFSWIAAFYIHFKTSFGPPPRYATPEIEIYLLALIPVWIVFMSSIRICGLYQPQRGKPLSEKLFNILSNLSRLVSRLPARVVSTKNIHALTLDMNIRIRHKVVQVYQISRDIFYSC